MADVVVTQADRAMADKAFDIAFRGDTDGIDDAMAQLFADHRAASTAALVEAINAILGLDHRDVFMGYDNGSGGGNYLWADYISLDEVKSIARAALSAAGEAR